MRKILLRSTFGMFAITLLLVFSISNSPTLALPAADNMQPGDEIQYENFVTFSWVASTDAYAYNHSDPQNNVVASLFYYEDFSDYIDEYGEIVIQSINPTPDGNKMAFAVGKGNVTNYGDQYVSYNMTDYLGLIPPEVGTYSSSIPSNTNTFNNEDRSFMFNNSFVPMPDWFLTMMILSMFMPIPDNTSMALGLNQQLPPMENPANNANYTFIDDFLQNFRPTLVNSSYNIGPSSFVINDNNFTFPVTRYIYENITTAMFAFQAYEMFEGPYNLTGAYWNVRANFSIFIDAVFDYDPVTGALLYTGSNITQRLDLYAITLIGGFDPDMNGTDYAPFDLMVTYDVHQTISFINDMYLTGFSYIYQPPPNPNTNTTSNDTGNNTTSQDNNTSTSSGNETSSNTTATPALNLPAPDFMLISTGLLSTATVFTLIRKRK